MRFHRTSLMMLAAGLLLPAGQAMAQQQTEGIVQLGHGADCLSADCCDGTGAAGNRSARGRNGRLLGGRGADGRYARNGECRHYAAARCNGGHCGFGGNPHYGHCGLGCWLNAHSPYHRCTVPPDHGFAPPAQRPIWPTPALYGRMFAGQPGAAVDPAYRHPMVYMPTDTTQLGFYYQQVPYWQWRPGMIPDVPHPDEWHTPYTGVVFTGFEDAASYHAEQGCPPDGRPVDGSIVNGPVGIPTVPSLPPGEAIESAPVPLHEVNPPYSAEPITPQLVPPAGQDELVPAPPAPSGQDLGKSAAMPKLIPVPRQ